MPKNNLEVSNADYWFKKAKFWMYAATFSLAINGGVIGAIIAAIILK